MKRAMLGLLVLITLKSNANEQAVVADTLREAKYAFCTDGNLGILIDFVSNPGNDISKDGNGYALFGYKTCNANEDFDWGTYKNMYFSVRINDGGPYILFPFNKDNDYLTATSTNIGLSGKAPTNAFMNNVQMKCYFLKSKATGELTNLKTCN